MEFSVLRALINEMVQLIVEDDARSAKVIAALRRKHEPTVVKQILGLRDRLSSQGVSGYGPFFWKVSKLAPEVEEADVKALFRSRKSYEDLVRS